MGWSVTSTSFHADQSQHFVQTKMESTKDSQARDSVLAMPALYFFENLPEGGMPTLNSLMEMAVKITMENFGTEYGGKPFADECKSICHALG
jgi:hypothetical protein